jgi:hypothetical protein
MRSAMADGLYYVEPVVEIIETVLYTACVRNEDPISIIIVGPSGVCKSKMLARYQSEAIHSTDSITSQGLYDVARNDPKGLVRFITMPDMNPTLSRKPATVQSTIANLLSFTSDGTVRIDDGRQAKECKHTPVGLVTAATDDIYNRQAKKWFALGLRRRIIPIFFKYTMETTRKLQALVREDKIHSTSPVPIKIKLTQKARPILPALTVNMIEALSLRFAMLLGKLHVHEGDIRKWYVREVVPISPQITLQNLARAHALRDNRPQANDEDYAFLCRFLDFCDPEHPKEI